jgi:hypothetical protein
VKIGDEAVYTVSVSFEGAAYPQSEIKQVKYLLYDAKNTVVTVSEATAVADGEYTITLSSDTTAKLEAGSNKIEVVVVPTVVSVPTFTSIVFVTAP